MQSIKSISIVGSGNVAHHLGKALVGQVKIKSVYSPNFDHCSALANDLFCYAAESIEGLLPADLVLICAKDDQIPAIVQQLPEEQKIAYTSGAVALNLIGRTNDLGVLYPLQTFNKTQDLDLTKVPFFIEATEDVFAQDLYDLASLLSKKVVFANSEDRKHLHLAAVMVNNFNNHLVHLAQSFLKDKKMEWEYLIPLIQETVSKLESTEPFEAQTGPARRGDINTINAHLDMLEGPSKELYKTISNSILKTYKHDEL